MIFLSQNVMGLKNTPKKKDFWEMIKAHSLDVMFIQETKFFCGGYGQGILQALMSWSMSVHWGIGKCWWNYMSLGIEKGVHSMVDCG